jgi:hypothetical protein
MCGLTRAQFRLLPGTYTNLQKKTARKYGARVKGSDKKIVEQRTPIKIALASESPIFLEGFRKILGGGKAV